MTDDILLIETNERVRTLTLNRPQSRNALSAALRDRFFGALTDAETDDDIDVVIVTAQIRSSAQDWISRSWVGSRHCRTSRRAGRR
jgi:enoyl-CoA hydratase/carnithine racemase